MQYNPLITPAYEASQKNLPWCTIGISTISDCRLIPALHVERSIAIEEPVDKVYPHIGDLNRWAAWNPWTEADPTVKNTITGSGQDIGSVWAWNGDKVEVGSLIIQEKEDNKFMQSRLAFEEPQMFESADIWTFESVGDNTKVTWINEGKLGYPIDRIFGLFMDRVLGEDFERGLTNVKHVAENS